MFEKELLDCVESSNQYAGSHSLYAITATTLQSKVGCPLLLQQSLRAVIFRDVEIVGALGLDLSPLRQAPSSGIGLQIHEQQNRIQA